jgi:hypothetical protein
MFINAVAARQTIACVTAVTSAESFVATRTGAGFLDDAMRAPPLGKRGAQSSAHRAAGGEKPDASLEFVVVSPLCMQPKQALKRDCARQCVARDRNKR